MLLKCQFHIHSKSDPEDKYVSSETDIIDHAANMKFDVIAFTCHNKVVHTEELRKYAEKKGILLIPGIEKDIGIKHVVILNPPSNEIEHINTFPDLEKYKKENRSCFIYAPHPYFYDLQSLGRSLIKNIDLFDSIEYSFFHTKKINPNKKAAKIAKNYNLPMLGTSDNHFLPFFDYTFSLIDAEEKTPESIFKAIKNFKTEIISKDLKFSELTGIPLKMFIKKCEKFFTKKL
jgi:predicted metal-dependent phosphoesterase TrpH